MNLLLSFGIFLGCLLPLTFCADDKLIFVQVVWRNGDRTPIQTFIKDPNQEKDWHQGFGQLTELGMQQHMDLGKKMRDRYVDGSGDGGYKLLNNSYRSNEIYVRSTDVNRTMISAISNLLSMYPGAANEAGFSYPNSTDWPKDNMGQGYVPIPIHTISDFYDYTLNPDKICERQIELWNLIITKTPEYADLTKQHKDLLDKLTKITGMDVTLDKLWMVVEALLAEKVNGKKWVKGIDEEMFGNMTEINDIVEEWRNGLNLQPLNGHNFSIEFPIIRGGSLLWSIIGHMQQKLECLKNSEQKFCSFFNNLKYYAFSAHDTTITALFSTLGLTHKSLNEDGYFHYSEAVAVELWQKDDLNNYVKIVYFPLESNTTNHSQEELEIPDCKADCSVDNFAKRSEIYKPLPSALELCATFLNGSKMESTTFFAPPKPTGAANLNIINFVLMIAVFLCFEL